MMLRTEDLHWLAGLLEGEGCFSINKGDTARNKNPYEIISLQMCDYDIVNRVCHLFDHDITICNTTRSKTVYRVTLGGAKAIGWMMTLYPLMGERRRSKIRECIMSWKSHRSRIRARGIWRRYGKVA